VLQGLAVLHAWAYAKRWHPGLVAPVYVLLVTPLMVLVILGLSALGLLDNWFDLRARLHSQA
jgi:UDP-N-acetylmuramyl pentapeptide phosphotransferase/UDP-N-acetylglucosamine-1-phosphate transferase